MAKLVSAPRLGFWLNQTARGARFAAPKPPAASAVAKQNGAGYPHAMTLQNPLPNTAYWRLYLSRFTALNSQQIQAKAKTSPCQKEFFGAVGVE